MENQPIKILGLTAEKLINLASGEYPNHLITVEQDVMDTEHIDESRLTKEHRIIIREEAMLATVAAMIERNNLVLLQHQKQLGVVQDQ